MNYKTSFRAKKFKWLKPMLDELEYVVSEYIDAEDEPPFWYNEAASVSMLVAAAARRKYIAISDYRAEKEKERKNVNGRCDLYISHEKNCVNIEAKMTYVRPNNIRERLDTAMVRAIKDAGCLKNCDAPAGLVFGVFSLSLSDGRDRSWQNSKQEIAGFKKEIEILDPDLYWMWWDTDGYDRYHVEEETRFHPGFAVLLKSA